jgi:ubiquinone/menaquinone biosynthesis C-methylase UbiE
MSYSSAAESYDFGYTIGFLGKDSLFRQRAVARLALGQGETVVDLCCGTGLNLLFLARAVGKNGTVIGVDQNASMLQVAQKKVQGMKNIVLLQKDIEQSIPSGDAVLCSFGLSVVQRPDIVVKKLHQFRRVVVHDLYLPDKHPILVRIMRLLTDTKDPNSVYDILVNQFPGKTEWMFKEFVYIHSNR